MRYAGISGKTILAVALAALRSAWGAPTTARPGTVNYVEGQVDIGRQQLGASAMGKTEVGEGQVLRTLTNGRAEVLLTPGAFLRVGTNSAIRMDSQSLTGTRVQLLHGKAMVEVAALGNHSNLLLAEDGAVAQIEKKGLYEFNADNGTVKVFDGKARVEANDQTTDVKKGKQVVVENAPLKATSFDKGASKDELYNWSAARSEYMSQASTVTAQNVIVNSPGWFGTGWYWNPWWDTWSFIPGAGYFYSPFGPWGFYSPYFVVGVPYYGYYGYRGYRGGRAPITTTRPSAGTLPSRAPSVAARPAPSMPMRGGGVMMPSGRSYAGPFTRFGRR